MDEDQGVNGAEVRFVASLFGPLKGSLLLKSIDLKWTREILWIRSKGVRRIIVRGISKNQQWVTHAATDDDDEAPDVVIKGGRLTNALHYK